MSEDGSVDLAIGIEIVNISDLASEIAQKLGTEKEQPTGKSETYNDTWRQISMMASVIRTMNTNFDEMMDDLQTFNRSVREDLIKTINKALRSGEEFDIDIANIEELTNDIVENLSGLLKNITVSPSFTKEVSEPIAVEAMAEVDEAVIEASITNILKNKVNDLEFINATLDDKVKAIQDIAHNITTVMAGGYMRFEDVKKFTRAIASDVAMAEQPSLKRENTKRMGLDALITSVRGTLEKMSPGGTFSKEELRAFLDDYGGSTLRKIGHEERLDESTLALKTAIDIFRTTEQNVFDKLDEIREVVDYTGEDIRISDIVSIKGQKQIAQIDEINQYMPSIIKLLESLQAIEYYNVEPDKKRNWATGIDFLSNIGNEVTVNRMSMIREIENPERLRAMINPSSSEEILRYMVNLVNTTFGEINQRYEQLDISSMENRGKTEVYQKVVEESQGKDVETIIRNMMNVIEPKYIEVKTGQAKGGYTFADVEKHFNHFMAVMTQKMTDVLRDTFGREVDFEDVNQVIKDLMKIDNNFRRNVGQRMKLVMTGYRNMSEQSKFMDQFNRWITSPNNPFERGDINLQTSPLTTEQLMDIIEGKNILGTPTISQIPIPALMDALKENMPEGIDLEDLDKKIQAVLDQNPFNQQVKATALADQLREIEKTLTNQFSSLSTALYKISTELGNMQSEDILDI